MPSSRQPISRGDVGPPGVALVQHRHERRQCRCDQDRTAPVEAAGVRQRLGLGKNEPTEDRAHQADRNIDPEGPVPAQRIEDQAAEGRAGAEPDRLGRRLQAKAAPALLRAGRHDDDGDAVRRDQGGTDGLQDPEEDQRRQVRREAAQARAKDEEEEAAGVEELAADHVGKPAEDRHERRHGQQIGDRDPAHAAEARPEFDFEPRQQHLCHAGIDLSHARADAYRSDHEPAIRREAGDRLRRRRLAPFECCRAQRPE